MSGDHPAKLNRIMDSDMACAADKLSSQLFKATFFSFTCEMFLITLKHIPSKT